MSSYFVDADAWSSGQIASKIWLCEELERLKLLQPQIIWLLGGWYAVSALLLLSRGQLPIQHIRSFDLDEKANAIADMINENWVWRKWRFKAFTADVNRLDYSGKEHGGAPTLVIHTAVEHFLSSDWFLQIPSQAVVVLQGSDLPLADHVQPIASTDQLLTRFKMSEIYFQGKLRFEYPENSYTRHMLIGRK